MSAADSSNDGSKTTRILAIVLASIVGFCAFLVGTLFLMKWHQQRRRALESANQLSKDLEAGPTSAHRRSSSISISTMSTAATPHKTVFVISEKQVEEKAPQSPSALPEIRITFPEEIDSAGKRQPGRVVSVRISENGNEGFEPYDEKLSSYQRDANDRFHSLDLDRIGGLKEKEVKA